MNIFLYDDPVDAYSTYGLPCPPFDIAFASGAVAIPIGKDLWVGSFRGDSIAIFPASK